METPAAPRLCWHWQQLQYKCQLRQIRRHRDVCGIGRLPDSIPEFSQVCDYIPLNPVDVDFSAENKRHSFSMASIPQRDGSKCINGRFHSCGLFVSDRRLHTPPVSNQTASPCTEAEVRRIVVTSPTRSCLLDPVPTRFLRDVIDLLLPLVTQMVNASLTESWLPVSQWHATVTPLSRC